ncbi:serine/threonine-protein kinase [Nocardioides panzhihuensis]|uniref:Serine/threonine protein kinase n=1 Tax=Nocardioides panzhihuensis TaxID=860243 RepID=A0A7Z0DRK5_9ACTN|nr:serine/threonine-protein kinase [Nocardioides panzhihuensis]NYI80485.1 serine/threonine protein kinase [Nocardioides panzhihuensis]
MGPYALTGRLGHGGMGVVYLGEDAAGMQAAVKAILPELTSDPGFRARFEREIEAAKKVESRFTARVLDADPGAEQPWMASEYVADPPLSKLVGSGQRLPEIDVRQLVAGVAEALAAVHATGLVHRDIKPGNILYGATDPCVIDMGIARSVDGTALTQTGKAVGTYGYQAPEQVQTGTFSSAVDIWALGLVAFVAATGRWPFSGEIGSMGHLLTGESPNLNLCPNYLRPLVAACLAEAPTSRPSAADILATNGDWTLLPAPVTSTVETFVGTPSRGFPAAAGVVRAPWSPGDTADLPTRAPTFAEPAQPSKRRWKVAVLAAAAAVLVSAGVAVAANTDLLPGREDAPKVGEVTPSAEPTAGQSSAPTTPVGGSVDTGTRPEVDETPEDEGAGSDGEIAPSNSVPSDDAAPSEAPEPSAPAPTEPTSEPVSPTPTAEPTETATPEPTEDPASDPTTPATS